MQKYRGHEMGPILGGSNLMQMYGKFEGFPDLPIKQGLGFFATVIGVFSYGGDISDCNGFFLQRC